MKDLSIVIPSINPETWPRIFDQIKSSVGNYSFEVICAGPNLPIGLQEQIQEGTFKYIEDFGCPSRSFQRGAEDSQGKYIAFIPDDCTLDEGAFEETLDFVKDKPRNHGVILLYDEGSGRQSKDFNYWKSSTHEDQRLAGVQPHWLTAPCFMYDREYFIEIGGLDCSYEHVNMNTHGVAYYIQGTGGEMHYSPRRIFKSSWSPPTEATILFQAYLQNDKPRFTDFWSQADAIEKYNVKFNNWKNQEEKWSRRYG